MIGFRSSSYWHKARRCSPAPSSLEGLPEEADLVVVGAGIFGLCTAIHVASLAPHLSIVVLEKSFPGAGSTGRSGGIIYVNDEYLPGSECNFANFAAWLQELGLHSVLAWGPLGRPARELEYPAYLVNPQLLVDRLADVGQGMGVRLIAHSPVHHIAFGDAHISVAARRCELRASHVVLAAGGEFAAEFFRELKIVFTQEHCVAVEVENPLDLPWNFAKILDPATDDFVWGRTLSSNKFLFGARVSGAVEPTEKMACILQSMHASVPSIKVTRVLAHWTGDIDRLTYSDSWRVFELGSCCRLFFAAGFNGQGLLGGYAAALDVARRIVHIQ